MSTTETQLHGWQLPEDYNPEKDDDITSKYRHKWLELYNTSVEPCNDI